MIGRSVDYIPEHFLHVVRRRWKCDQCKKPALLDELEFFAATIYDRGRMIIRACRRCQGKRRRLEWLDRASLRRLEARIKTQGFGCGAELVWTLKRLGLGPSRSAAGRVS